MRTQDGRAVRLLAVIDEYTRECLAIRADRHFRSRNVIETLADLMTRRGVPDHIRSDNGPEFTAKAIREWLGKVGVRTLYIEPGSPWENGYVESFNGKLRDESLDREIFYTLKEVRILTEQYRHTYNQIRPHSSLGSKPPAPQAVLTAEPIPGLVGLTYQLVQRLGAGQVWKSSIMSGAPILTILRFIIDKNPLLATTKNRTHLYWNLPEMV